MNTALKNLKKVWNIISTLIVIIAMLFALFLLGTRLLGYKCYAVISGSMAPKYSVGDLIYVKEADPNTIEEGDSITFILNEQLTVATHEVERVDKENLLFYTKGEANATGDEQPVHFNNVIGVTEFSIPLLGYVTTFLHTVHGMYISIAIGIALLLLVFFPDLLIKRNSKKESPDAEEENSSEDNVANSEFHDDKDDSQKISDEPKL